MAWLMVRSNLHRRPSASVLSGVAEALAPDPFEIHHHHLSTPHPTSTNSPISNPYTTPMPYRTRQAPVVYRPGSFGAFSWAISSIAEAILVT